MERAYIFQFQAPSKGKREKAERNKSHTYPQGSRGLALEAQLTAPKVKVVATGDQGQDREGKVSVTGLEAGRDRNVGRQSGGKEAFRGEAQTGVEGR